VLRQGPGRDDDPSLPPPARAAQADGEDLRGDQGPARIEATVPVLGDDRGRDDRGSAELDEERGEGPGPGDEADQEGQELALRDEVPRRDGPAGDGPQPDGDACGGLGSRGAPEAVAR